MIDKPLREIDTAEYLNALCSILSQGEGVSTVVTGSSMAPFLISNKSWVYLEKTENKLSKGDIALYVRSNGDFVLHRVYKVDGDDLYFVGDAQSVIEGPVPHSRVKGVVTKYKRRKNWHDTSTLVWRFFSKIWIRNIKFRCFAMKTYFSFRRFLHKIIYIIHK
ncbi:MAG: S24/S26 family peptidase [Ruminococcus sp.]|nr:S24/S26 family peptidase [Ruminococcus sp.]